MSSAKNVVGQILRFICFTSLTLFSFHSSFAQDTVGDSLKHVLSLTKHDTTRIDLLLSLSDHYSYSNADTALFYCSKARRLASAIDDKKRTIRCLFEQGWNTSALGHFNEALRIYEEALGIAKGINNSTYIASSLQGIGTAYWNQSNYPKALEYFFRSLEIANSVKDKNGIVRNYVSIGIVYMEQSDYPKALDFYFKALKISEELKDKNKILAITTNIGIIYKELHNYQKALTYYFRGLMISEEAGDKSAIATQYGNIGVVYMDKKEYVSALNYFLKALTIFEDLGDKNGIAINLGNIGMAYQNTKDFDKALYYYNQALSLNNELGRINGIARQLGNIGGLYVLKKEYGPGEKYLLRAVSISDSIGALELTRSFEELLSDLYVKSNRPQPAFEHFKKFIAVRDSIFSQENKNKTLRSEMRFEFEQKEAKTRAEQEIKEILYKEEIKQQRTIRLGITAISIISILISFLLFNRYRLKQKHAFEQKLIRHQKEQAAAIIETQEQERKRIAEDLHDSLGHLLSTVKLNLQTLPADQKHHYVNSLQLLNQASNEIRDISFNLMPQTLEEEGLVAALHELADKIRKSSLYDIILKVHDMDEVEIDKQMKFNIYRIVQEAVNNVMKHADAKEINIQLVKQNKSLSVMIEDDGKGFNMTEIKKNGRGLRNITARAEWLLGNIQIDSTPGRGTTISIEIPIGGKNDN